MRPELTARLHRDWEALLPWAPVSPETVKYLGLPGAVEGGTTTFIAFGPRRRPLFVVKVFRHSDDADRAAAEQEALEFLASHAAALCGDVPRLLLATSVRGLPVLVQSVVAGRPMAASTSGPLLTDSQAGAVMQWLDAVRRLPPIGDRRVPAFDSVLQRFEQLLRPAAPQTSVLSGLRASCAQLSHFDMPICHGDFCRQNLLFTEAGALAVVDWTDAQFGGFPCEDLLLLLLTSLMQRRPSGMPMLEYMHDMERGVFAGLDGLPSVSSTISTYCARYDIPGDIDEHWGLFLVAQATREAARLSRLAPKSGLPRFTVWLAQECGASYAEAMILSVWLVMFRHLTRPGGRWNMKWG